MSAAEVTAAAKTLLGTGVRNHGWYLREAEHRQVLGAIERLEATVERQREALERIAGFDVLGGTTAQVSAIARAALYGEAPQSRTFVPPGVFEDFQSGAAE